MMLSGWSEKMRETLVLDTPNPSRTQNRAHIASFVWGGDADFAISSAVGQAFGPLGVQPRAVPR
ncbi:hypothetical protein BMF89_21350 [Arthrobacter sp. SRS-W-1-2016]|nr:hypothetical protein BMF89_21350 [Arthrobacter sp. SRS-W-1-2016]